MPLRLQKLAGNRLKYLATTHTAAYYPDDFGQEIFDTLNGYYKYMWYGFFRDAGGGAGEDASGYDFMAEGDRGQFIYVSPQPNSNLPPGPITLQSAPFHFPTKARPLRIPSNTLYPGKTSSNLPNCRFRRRCLPPSWCRAIYFIPSRHIPPSLYP